MYAIRSYYGRTKSAYYAARTTQVYRQVIEDAAAGREFNMDLMEQLEGLSNRGYTEGFYGGTDGSYNFV